MNFSCGIRILLVSFLLAIVLHEGSAELTKYEKIVFRARQVEAIRNRRKYNNIPRTYYDNIYNSFLMKNDFTEFVLPTLSNDNKLEQTFTLHGEKFNLVCRRGSDYDTLIGGRQAKALNSLKHRKMYLYAASKTEHTSFTLFQTPLTLAEEEIILQEYRLEYCTIPPMPGLQQLVTEIEGTQRGMLGRKHTVKHVKNIEYKYGEDQQTCNYFQLGIETLRALPDNKEDAENPYPHYKWAPLFNVCHDVTNSVTAFTEHTIKWDHLIHRKLNPNIKVNPTEEKVFVGEHYDQYYDLKNQEKSFEASECKKEKNEFDKDSNFLKRAHLVPEYDHSYESLQYISRNYLNYVPQWRSVNMGEWLDVEQDIRFIVSKLQKDVTVFTGVHYRKNACTLNIPVRETEVEPIPLRVPSIFYKYVHTDKAGIVIIIANGISGDVYEIKCTPVCDLYGWLYTKKDYRHRSRKSSGQIKCCTPDDFFNQEEIKHSLPSPPKEEFARTKILTFDGLEVDVKDDSEAPHQVEDFLGRGGAMFLEETGSLEKIASEKSQENIKNVMGAD